MERILDKKHFTAAMGLGILGCLCYGGGDWLMLYGDMTGGEAVYWLTEGVKQIAPWRNNLAMLLAFPGILCYGAALFYLQNFITEKKSGNIYHYLNVFGLTPWIALHLFYVMILYLYYWMNQNGYSDISGKACGALFEHLSWVVPLSEAFMLPVFLYWFYLVAKGKTMLPRWMAFTNVLPVYLVLYMIKTWLPASAFKMGFTNGLMSESMLLFFAVIFVKGLPLAAGKTAAGNTDFRKG